MRDEERNREDKNESKMDKNNVSIIINGNKAEKRAETTLENDTHMFCTLKYEYRTYELENSSQNERHRHRERREAKKMRNVEKSTT